ncbi:alpha/beta hydrolase [Sphingomonas sp.]|jgi:acetyl esterase/lipase|uniref:alpha/beta hydrolase n=1 Tax=Sphingomonas sp. TaxID=28214 RepID=UPI002ED8B6BA
MKIARRTLLATGLALPAVARAVPADPVVERFPLWPSAPPGGEGLKIADEVVKRSPNGPEDDIAWPHVATPMLTVVPAAKPNGAAVLIVPGGGYTRVAVGRKGGGISRMFAERGITAFELLYRLPHDGWAAGPDAPLQDAQRAIRVIREKGSRWGVDPARIAALGFSAGGHLAARLGSRSSLATYKPVDAADRHSARPVVLGLFFPVITLAAPDAHGTSRRELLGADASPDRITRFSAENDLPADMPPTFVAHAANDPAVPVANSLRMFGALQAAKIASELMIFELGGHDLPLTQPDGGPHPWPNLFLSFASRHGL